MRVYTVQCREPKTGQQKVQLYCKDEIHCRSGYSLSMTVVKGQKKISFLTDRWWFGKKNSLLLKTVVMRQKKISLLIDCRDVAKQSFFYDFRLSFSWYQNIHWVVWMLAKTGVFRANRDSNFVRILLHLSKQRFQDIKFFIYSLYTEYIYRRQHDTDYI